MSAYIQESGYYKTDIMYFVPNGYSKNVHGSSLKHLMVASGISG
ncbi:unnamed protein product [Acanthoscelides obtectus]|uniref:Uncharacterized protein n=1 Tax=Acanthoscelides obtectus TaxID=200917 RepID=A0A9P0PJA3_ACAOB|nr:unnamed protein product [Acanthoscelides obtectus]CAK1650205.1 hypothetical protein AOBTE_LOCUS16683 [Acanthoscelides obtectus]